MKFYYNWFYKLCPRCWQTIGFVAALIATAVAIDFREGRMKELLAEVMWKFGALITLLLSYAGQGSQILLDYLGRNSSGITTLATLIGLGFSIYYQIKNNKSKTTHTRNRKEVKE